MAARTAPVKLLLREACPEDASLIAELYDSLCDASFSSRFLRERGPTGAGADVSLQPGRTVALLALDATGLVLGEARYERFGEGPDEDTAELAVTVRDDAQGAGVGRRLLARLVAVAQERGVRRLLSVVRTDNAGMLALLGHSALIIVEPTEGGVVTVETATDGGVPGWGAPSTRPRLLVEAATWWDPPRAAALRRAGYDVRHCRGPGGSRACPLVATGSCTLVEEADAVLCLLPDADPAGRAVRDSHERDRPERLV